MNDVEESIRIVTEAKEILKDPKRWIRGDLARDENGYSIDPKNSGAVCFCTLGAMIRASKEKTMGSIACIPQELLIAVPVVLPGSIGEWNDAPDRKHEDVMEFFDRLINHIKEKYHGQSHA